MKKFSLFFYIFIQSCGSNPKRVHTTANVPRGVVFDSQGNYQEENLGAIGGSFQHSTSWSEDGHAGESNLFNGDGEIKPIRNLSLGLMLNLGRARGNSSDPVTFGGGAYARLRMIQSDAMSLYLYGFHTRVSNTNNGKSCSRDVNAWDCSNQNTMISSTAEIKIREYIAALMMENHFNQRSSLGIVPMFKYSDIRTNNYLYQNPTLSYSANFWTPTVMLYYIYRSRGENSSRTMIQTGVGVSKEKNFNLNSDEEKIILADVGIFTAF